MGDLNQWTSLGEGTPNRRLANPNRVTLKFQGKKISNSKSKTKYLIQITQWSLQI